MHILKVRYFFIYFLWILFLPNIFFASKKLIFLDTHSALIKKESTKNPHIIWLAIHENEFEATRNVDWAFKKYGGKSFKITNLYQKKERVLFGFLGFKKYLYDPNRIFTQEGKIKNLHYYNLFLTPQKKHFLKPALNQLKEVKKRFLKALHLSSSTTLIALHNNLKRGKFSLYTYQRKKRLGFLVYKNPKMHPKNFILVTQKKHFDALKQRKINVVLQPKPTAKTTDGSLGDYCTIQGYSYFNIETRFGSSAIQRHLVNEVFWVVQNIR